MSRRRQSSNSGIIVQNGGVLSAQAVAAGSRAKAIVERPSSDVFVAQEVGDPPNVLPRNPMEPEDTTGPLSTKHFHLFLSYASEDRDVAQGLDHLLDRRGYRVWRDRGQLTLGDSLTAKINEGLAASRFGIVILSKAFLLKNWPQAELNALQARAVAEGRKVILPIRRDLDHEEMAKHLPLLGDKLTIAFAENRQEVAAEIERAIGSPNER